MAQKRKKTAGETLRLLSDQAIGEGTPTTADGLGFRNYSKILASVAMETPGPFTVGIFGEWGTGKTSLMRMVEEYLSTEKNVITVWFNAWRFESEEQPIVPLVATIVREIERNKTFLSTLADGGKSLLRGLRAVAYGFSAKSKVKIPGFAEIEASFVAKDMIDRSESIAPDPLLERSIFFEAFQQLSRAQIPDSTRVVVLIDDLDRCFPDKAIKLLESIKLVLGQPGFIFFLGVARRVLEGYLHYRYEKEYGITGFDGYAYLDKIVQLPFHIPPHRNRMPTFWDSVIFRLGTADRRSFKELVPILNLVSGSNPRSAIRFVNNLLVDRAIFRAIAGDKAFKEMPIEFFAVSRSLEQRWLSMFSLLSRSNEICDKVASWMPDQLPKVESLDSPELKEVAGLLRIDQELIGLLATQYGIRWLSEHDRRSATIDFLQEERSEAEDVHSEVDNKYDVIVVSSSKDGDAARQVRAVLDELGLKVFNMRPMFAEETIISVLESGIAFSRAMVVLLGKSSSEWQTLMFQVGKAQGQNKIVIPVLLPGAEAESLPYNLNQIRSLKIESISKSSLHPIVKLVLKEN